MKKIILSLAIGGALLMAATACNSTKNVSNSTDSTVVDTAVVTPRADTMVKDTSIKMPPDTTRM